MEIRIALGQAIETNVVIRVLRLLFDEEDWREFFEHVHSDRVESVQIVKQALFNALDGFRWYVLDEIHSVTGCAVGHPWDYYQFSVRGGKSFIDTEKHNNYLGQLTVWGVDETTKVDILYQYFRKNLREENGRVVIKSISTEHHRYRPPTQEAI